MFDVRCTVVHVPCDPDGLTYSTFDGPLAERVAYSENSA